MFRGFKNLYKYKARISAKSEESGCGMENFKRMNGLDVAIVDKGRKKLITEIRKFVKMCLMLGNVICHDQQVTLWKTWPLTEIYFIIIILYTYSAFLRA